MQTIRYINYGRSIIHLFTKDNIKEQSKVVIKDSREYQEHRNFAPKQDKRYPQGLK